MTDLLPRLRKVRERAVQRATAVVEDRRRSLDEAKATLDLRDRLLEVLDAQAERLSAWLGREASDPVLRMGALARIDVLASDLDAAIQARSTEAAAVVEAGRRLQEARIVLGRANARLSGVDTLARAAASAADRRRERLAEIEQEARRPVSPMER